MISFWFTWYFQKLFLYPASYFSFRNTKRCQAWRAAPPDCRGAFLLLDQRVISKKNIAILLLGWQAKALGEMVVYNNKKWPNNCQKRSNLPKILKVESIYNYTISCQSASINRWRHWKTRDLGVWHQSSIALEGKINDEKFAL